MNFIKTAWALVKGASGFLKLLNPWLWLGVALVVIGGFVGFKWWTNSLIEQGRQEVRAEALALENSDLRTAKAEISRLINFTNNLNEAYREQVGTIDDLERRARSAGLRITKAERDAAIASGSAEAIRNYASTAGDVYSACRDEYRALGYDAARGASSAHTLKQWIDNWPDYRAFQSELEAFKSQLKGK